MTIKDIQKYLGVHEMTVYRWAKSGKIPLFKIGGRWRARREDIEKIGRIK